MYGGYGPYPYPGPVVLQQAPLVMQQPVVVGAAPAPVSAPVILNSPQMPPSGQAPPPAAPFIPPPNPYNATTPVVTGSAPASSGVALNGPQPSALGQAGVDSLLQQLNQSDENVRRDAIMDLGRMKADRAIDPLTSALNTDSSPVVRDAAARALGLDRLRRSRCRPCDPRGPVQTTIATYAAALQFATYIEVISLAISALARCGLGRRWKLSSSKFATCPVSFTPKGLNSSAQGCVLATLG